MGLAGFNERVSQIRDMITQRGIDLKSDKLEYEIARLIAKHYDTLKEYDIIEILNEVSDSLDSKLTYAENMAIAEKIIGKYLGENGYSTKDYVESYEEALENWNKQVAQELTQQYYEKEQENAVDWDKVLKPVAKPRDSALPLTEEPIVKPVTGVQVERKLEALEVSELREKLTSLETQITLLDSKITQLVGMEKPKAENPEVIRRIERVEKETAEIKEKLSQLEIALNNILKGELGEIKAKVEELRKAGYKPVTVDNRVKPGIPEEEKPEDKIQRRLIAFTQKVVTKSIDGTLKALNWGFNAYVEGLSYMESSRKPRGKRSAKTVKM